MYFLNGMITHFWHDHSWNDDSFKTKPVVTKNYHVIMVTFFRTDCLQIDIENSILEDLEK